MNRSCIALGLSLLSIPALASTPIQPLIDAALPGSTIVLPDGVYDDAAPVLIEKTIGISGTRAAIVHSEFMVRNAVQFFANGVTFDLNKIGAPSHTGKGYPFPQNGMITILGATAWLDDVRMQSEPGFTKDAIYVLNGMLNFRTVTQYSSIDWRNNTAKVIELLYGSNANIFDISGTGLSVGISAQTDSATGAAIFVVGSRLTYSGANMWNFGTSIYGIQLARMSHVLIGAGLPSSVNGFLHNCATGGDGTTNDLTIEPGCTCTP
jgi:hypothetical protein